jgi:hypothetical protein
VIAPLARTDECSFTLPTHHLWRARWPGSNIFDDPLKHLFTTAAALFFWWLLGSRSTMSEDDRAAKAARARAMVGLAATYKYSNLLKHTSLLQTVEEKTAAKDRWTLCRRRLANCITESAAVQVFHAGEC